MICNYRSDAIKLSIYALEKARGALAIATVPITTHRYLSHYTLLQIPAIMCIRHIYIISWRERSIRGKTDNAVGLCYDQEKSEILNEFYYLEDSRH
ncbi:hypothetical protein VNO80_16407 [Phaseolus coccineus]|uniref:Uncharacterized protein n=1 Tax=Phaseolus coccineus TaxID=3886 RepID=A0AAN9R3W7_PHACN